MTFRISSEYPVRQVFGWFPGFPSKDGCESYGPPYLMADVYIGRAHYVGRQGKHGIYFKDFTSGWVFVQPRDQVVEVDILNNP